jgi:hypothetical protein
MKFIIFSLDIFASIAQLEEQEALNFKVAGSSPAGGIINYNLWNNLI